MVIRDICNTLCIPNDGTSLNVGSCSLSASSQLNDDDGVKVLNCDRDNIDVFSLVLQSNDERQYLLHKILKEKTKEMNDNDAKKLPINEGCLSKGSVIIYVWRQKDTEIVAEQLNGAGIRGGIVCYHGGMDANSRSKAQSKFLRGKARICVATVAFGLGINKPDIEGVIHLCLPPSPEHYLQEIGRAGRDGRPAIAIALPLLEELVTRHSLAHSDRLSNSQLSIIFRSLQKLVNEALNDIPPEAGVDLDASELFIDDTHIAMPVAQTVDASDCKEEWIETIFSLLEGETLSNSSLLRVEGYLPDVVTITLKKRSLDKLEQLDPIARSIAKCGSRVDELSNIGGTAMEKGFYAYSFGTYKFSVVHCARCMGPQTEPRHVYAALRRMQNSGELELVLDTTANGRALHLRMTRAGLNLFREVRGQESTNDIGEDLQKIVTKLLTQFTTKELVTVGKVESMYEIIHHVSCAKNHPEKEDMSDVDDDDDISNKSDHVNKSARLIIFQKMVQQYFNNVAFDESASNTSKALDSIKDFPIHDSHLVSCLISDISLLLQMLVLRRQEQMPMAVHINNPAFTDYRDLCIAKILHAIDSPRAPILQWYSHVLWGKYRAYSFSSVVQAVKKTFNSD
jgi:ATP-dependent DNA helicase Q4